MFKKAGWVSLAALVAACSGGNSGTSGEDLPAVPPPGIAPPTVEANSAPAVTTREVRVQFGEDMDVAIATADANGDPVTLTLVDGPEWLTLTSTGQLTGTPGIDDVGTFEIAVEANDGTDTTRATIEITLFIDPVEQALATGDFTYITEHSDTDVETVAIEAIEALIARNRDAIIDIYELNPDGTGGENSVTGIEWTPDALSAHFSALFPYSFPLIISNRALVNRLGVGRNMAVLGEIKRGRYALFANSPRTMGAFDIEQPNSRLIKNTIDWMVQTDTSDGLHVVMAQIPNGGQHNGLVSILDAAYPDNVSYNEFGTCDSNRLESCMTDEVDLIISFQNIDSVADQEAVIEQMRLALDRGVAVLFVRRFFNEDNDDFADRVLELLQSGGAELNYPYLTGIENGHGEDVVGADIPTYFTDLVPLLQGLRDETLEYDLSVCSGPVECEENTAFNEEVFTPLNALRSEVLNRYSAHLGDPFEQYDHNAVTRAVAALTLTGDYYRSVTRFPMPPATMPSQDIIQALFGEFANVPNRATSPVMPDMGVFSRSDFDAVSRVDLDVTLSGNGPFHATGLYALPGEPFTITRNDLADVDIEIGVNAFSADSALPFITIDDTEYRHPFLVNSDLRTLSKTITVTGNGTSANLHGSLEMVSVYGGPIFVYVDSPDEEINLSFSNVGEHPTWRGAEDNESFLIALAADEFDWAEILTPSVELHATADALSDTLDAFGSPAALAEAMETYMYSWPLWLDGRQGDGIQENPDLAAFIEAHGIIPPTTSDDVLHWYAGDAACEPNCGENPVSSFGDPDPTAYRSLYAQGAALSNPLLSLSSGPENAFADLFAIHSKYRLHQQTGEPVTDCHPLPHREVYEMLQNAYASGDPFETITEDDMRPADVKNVMYIQLMAALQSQDALDDGWTYLPRLNVVSRVLENRRGSIQGWNEHRASIGLPITPHHIINAFTGHRARMTIALSWAAQRNLVGYIEMWGYDVAGNETAQTGRWGFDRIRPVFYAIPETGHCTSLDYDELPIDGVSTWP